MKIVHITDGTQAASVVKKLGPKCVEVLKDVAYSDVGKRGSGEVFDALSERIPSPCFIQQDGNYIRFQVAGERPVKVLPEVLTSRFAKDLLIHEIMLS